MKVRVDVILWFLRWEGWEGHEGLRFPGGDRVDLGGHAEVVGPSICSGDTGQTVETDSLDLLIL